MAKKVYWKDIRHSFSSSKGRFLSIFSLMMIGALTLVGLKITTPNMQKSAQNYINKTHLMDLSIISNYGISSDDQKELDDLKNVTIEYGYMTDVSIKNTSKALRVFSNTENISKFTLTSGRFPKKINEIVLSDSLKKNYHIGDTLYFENSNSDKNSLKTASFTVTGFAKSAEIWNVTNMGAAAAGDGSLSGYAITSPKAFESDVYTIARLQYDDLKTTNYYGKSYKTRLNNHQQEVNKVLKDNGLKRYESIKNNLTENINKGTVQIKQAKAQINEMETKLKQQEELLKNSGLDSSSEPIKALETSKNKFEQEKSKAEENIKNSEKQLETAKTTLETLAIPTYKVFTRSNLPGGQGYMTYDSSTSSISSVGNIFPIVLYLVAAMVTFTTMTRFVDEERKNAGIFKALGYTNRDIIRKFVLYGIAASLSGTILGIVIGNFYISNRISSIVTANTVIGSPELYFYPSYTILALILAVISAVLPAYLVAKKELTEEPAQLLLAKPPVSGSKILLEHISFIWKRLNFTHKVTARNIFRYKQRMLMTIFGVAGSVALLFTGLGIRSSLSGVVTSQFGDILHYHLIVTKKDSISSKQDKDVRKILSSKNIKNYLDIDFLSTQQEVKTTTDKQDVSIIVTNQKDELSEFITLRQRASGKQLHLTDNGIILSEKLAKLYNVKLGDNVTISIDNESYDVSIQGISEMYTGHFIYMTAKFYHNLTNKTYSSNAYLVNLKAPSTENISKLSKRFLKEDAVTAVIQNTSLINQLKTVSRSLQSVMIILIVLSILLGIVILYNLTNINVAERIRELSTIKVLGFHDKEVTLYIYRETMLLSFIGILVGLLGGYLLHRFLLGMIGSDAIMFNPRVTIDVYLIPIVTILMILSILGYYVNNSLKEVDMLESLKSVD